MKNPKIFRWTYLAVKWLIAAAFFYAGAVKLADAESFARVIDSYGLVPDLLVAGMAYIFLYRKYIPQLQTPVPDREGLRAGNIFTQ